MEQPTIRIKDPGFPDGLIINLADFDPEVHQEFGTPDKPVPPADGANTDANTDASAPAPAPAPAPTTPPPPVVTVKPPTIVVRPN